MVATLQTVQKQVQKLHLTNEMQQSIEILRCDREELEQYLRAMTVDNPLLEYEAPTNDVAMAGAYPSTLRMHTTSTAKDGLSTMDQWLPSETNMLSQIENQLRMMDAARDVKGMAIYLAGMLDEDGYLREHISGLSTHLGKSVVEIEEGLQLLQQVDPAGIGATNLQECLLLQLRTIDADVDKGLLRVMITEHMQRIADHRINEITERTGRSAKDVQKAADILKTLNPSPGRMLQPERTTYVRPEILVTKSENQYVVALKDDVAARLRVNDMYRELAKTTEDEAAKEYLTARWKSVDWLRSCVAYRQSTLERIATAIVERQQGFFEHGDIALRSLTLRDLSEDIQMHESTVSRAIRGAYMETPRGVIAMKHFLSAELAGGVSAMSAKHMLKIIVDREDPTAPYSDALLVKKLGEMGIAVSRRTITKYRKQLHIASSTKRRRRV